jgi:serine phosphatase RsbU (regulator of sigma subunit)
VKERSSRRPAIVLAAVALLLVIAGLGVPYLRVVLGIGLAAGLFLLLLWLLWRASRAFLWKVGRRLAFSYFLIGVLPIPMLALLLGVAAYILSGFFLGHLYRDAAANLQLELDRLAESRAVAFAETGVALRDPSGTLAPRLALGYYRDGRRVAGDPRTPAAWPGWAGAGTPARRPEHDAEVRFVALGTDRQTLAATAARGRVGVIALFADDLDLELSRRSDVWIAVSRPDDPNLQVVHVGFGRRDVPPLLRVRHERRPGEAEKFFKRTSAGHWLLDRPLLWWGEISGPLLDPASGRQLAAYMAVTLNGTPRTVLRHLFSNSADLDAAAWGTLLLVALLLFWVYVVALVMAAFMIFGLSRAVNRLSRATAAVQSGDFSARIAVRRRDQLGALERSFNAMAANLETLVATATQKELLEKELALARDLQKSLIPSDLPAAGGIEFATLFEPSAAIGGDYFDVLRLSERELAVIIADVAGHGLSTGLRMAMLKAALSVLIEQTREPEAILSRLDEVVRTDGGRRRFFVTATLGLLDLESGELRLTNAGHPPTYRVRGGRVEEILLPGSALGGLGHSYGHATLALARGDVVVWLSDGLIEATNAAGDPFGYDSVVAALAGDGLPAAGETATAVRDRLLAALLHHVGGEPPGDDRTLVVMRYGRDAAATA